MPRKKIDLDFDALDYTEQVLALVKSLWEDGLSRGKIMSATGISEHRVEVAMKYLRGTGKKPVFRYAQVETCIETHGFCIPPVESKEYVRCDTCGGKVSSVVPCYLCTLRESRSKRVAHV